MSFAGTWDVTVNSPMGAKVFRIEVQTGEGTVQGTVSLDGETAPLIDPALADGHLRWSVKMPRPMNILLEVDLTEAGDGLTGLAKAGRMVLPEVKGTRIV